MNAKTPEAKKVRFVPTSGYEPPSPFWKGPHRQLLVAEWIKAFRTPALAWRKTTFSIPGVATSRAFVLDPTTPAKGTLAIFHGLGGVADGANLRRLAAEGAARGFRSISFEMPGAGADVPVERLYTAADVGIFDGAARFLEAEAAPRPFVFAALSLAGGMLLRWLGLLGAANPADAAIALCPTAHLPSSADALSRFDRRLYDLRFAFLYGRRVRRGLSSAGRRAHGWWRHRSMRRLDEDFASLWAGAPSAVAYYDAASAHHVARSIARPTLIVASKDDPFVPYAPLVEHFGSAPFVDLRLSDHGAHVAFLAREGGELKPSFPKLLLDPVSIDPEEAPDVL
jgi:uncharacterized protein